MIYTYAEFARMQNLHKNVEVNDIKLSILLQKDPAIFGLISDSDLSYIWVFSIGGKLWFNWMSFCTIVIWFSSFQRLLSIGPNVRPDDLHFI